MQSARWARRRAPGATLGWTSAHPGPTLIAWFSSGFSWRQRSVWLFGSFSCRLCLLKHKRKVYTEAPGRDLSPKTQLQVCVCVGAFDAGTHVSRQHMTLLSGPQSQHEPRLQGETEGCPWLLRKLCLDFPATSLGTAAATAWTHSQPSVGLRNSSERAAVSPLGWGREGSRCRVEGGSK